MELIWLECWASFKEQAIPSSIGCFNVLMLRSNGWSSGGEFEMFEDKAVVPQGDKAEEHDMKEPALIIKCIKKKN